MPYKVIKRFAKFQEHFCVFHFIQRTSRRCYHGIPFVDFYQRTTGLQVSEKFINDLKKQHPNIDKLSHDRLQCTVQILNKFDISALDACRDMHVFTMNPITMDNYGEILRECGFIKIIPKYIIRYHTLVRSRTIAWLKKEGLLREDLELENLLLSYFSEWPAIEKSLQNFPDSNTSILKIRMSVLEKYLRWKLLVTPEEFSKYCRNYLPLKHKPMCDIQEAINIAQNDIQFDKASIRKNGFIISSDPINTKLIIENVQTIAGLDIREAIRMVPAILKNNYNALLKIRNLLEEYRIPEESQRKCLRVFCMCPKTVKERLDELKNLKEYKVLRTNPRALSMVVHKKKVMDRLEKINVSKRNCFSLNHLVSSSKVFNNYISSFGHKVWSRDIIILINSSLQSHNNGRTSDAQAMKLIKNKLKKHKYWLYIALNVVDENIHFLKKRFDDKVILNNCQLLLYPITEVEQHLENLLRLRSGLLNEPNNPLFASYTTLNCSLLSDDQILSLVLYEIEKTYHFSGDGVWTTQDGLKINKHAS